MILAKGKENPSVNYVHGIQFRTTELRQYRDEARALAIRVAREKAEAMAKELGETVGRPENIREDNAGWWSGYESWWGRGQGGGPAQNVVQNLGGSTAPEGALAPGQIAVTARVTVSFALAD